MNLDVADPVDLRHGAQVDDQSPLGREPVGIMAGARCHLIGGHRPPGPPTTPPPPLGPPTTPPPVNGFVAVPVEGCVPCAVLTAVRVVTTTSPSSRPVRIWMPVSPRSPRVISRGT